jgi:hypothetical protein
VPSKEDMKVFLETAERGLAASAMKDTIVSCLTATSIILAAAALVVSLRKGKNNDNDALRWHYRWVAWFSLFSISLGCVNMAFFPSLINTQNVSFSFVMNLLAAVQFTLMVCAASRLSFAIRRSI